ncbi:hypothetical protein I3Y_28705 (plasmid) [Escherichia coli O145 str. RM9872]|nr:hypothetical protein I3Y_28705 [Escherichia coli O145 str. RM9872]
MLPSETMIWQPEFTDKTLSRKPGAVQTFQRWLFFSVNTSVRVPHTCSLVKSGGWQSSLPPGNERCLFIIKFSDRLDGHF